MGNTSSRKKTSQHSSNVDIDVKSNARNAAVSIPNKKDIKKSIESSIMLINVNFGPFKSALVAQLFIEHFDESTEDMKQAHLQFLHEISIFMKHGDTNQKKAAHLLNKISPDEFIVYAKIAAGM